MKETVWPVDKEVQLKGTLVGTNSTFYKEKKFQVIYQTLMFEKYHRRQWEMLLITIQFRIDYEVELGLRIEKMRILSSHKKSTVTTKERKFYQNFH